MKTTIYSCILALACTSIIMGQTPATQSSNTPLPQAAAAADPFPPADPKFFDVTSPSAADVDAFLKIIWGYDPNRTWRVEAIQKTPAPGVARVTVFVADKSQGNKVENLRFFVTPDGKHAIADQVFSFGPHPYDETRDLLRAKADGPSSGSPNKALELVEFADMQCPHCKEAAPLIANLRRDFPNAHFVFQNFALIQIHPYALKAAAYGNCVRQAKGDAAFFTYLDDVFAHQDSLTPELGDTTLTNAAQKAGADPASTAACAATPAARDLVMKQNALAEEARVEQTPTLAVNGHLLAIGAMPYETLKQIVTWDAQRTGGGAGLAAK